MFYQHWGILHVLKHSQQCTGSLPIYLLPNALLTTYYLCKINEFSMKSIKMWLTSRLQGQGWIYHISVSLLKFHWKQSKNSHYTTHSLYNVLPFPWMSIQVEAQVLDPGRDDYHLKVEVTWEQQKLPGGLDFHLMKRRALGDEWTWCCSRFWVWKEHSHIFMKDSLGNNILKANQSCVGMEWKCLWLWRTKENNLMSSKNTSCNSQVSYCKKW